MISAGFIKAVGACRDSTCRKTEMLTTQKCRDPIICNVFRTHNDKNHGSKIEMSFLLKKKKVGTTFGQDTPMAGTIQAENPMTTPSFMTLTMVCSQSVTFISNFFQMLPIGSSNTTFSRN